MATKRKSKSLVQRAIALVAMLLTGSGAGLGGWLFKDHPNMRALLGSVLGQAQEHIDAGEIKDSLTSAVSKALNRENPREPGVFQVKIAEIKLEPSLFKEGRTVDIQAQVRKLDANGNSALLWESKAFGQNLAVAGKDELTAAFPNRPFEVSWQPGDRIVVEIWDRKAGLFDRKEILMSPSDAGSFPLASGSHTLVLKGRDGVTLDSQQNHIVFQTARVGDAGIQRDTNPRAANPREVAERPIVIK